MLMLEMIKWQLALMLKGMTHQYRFYIKTLPCYQTPSGKKAYEWKKKYITLSVDRSKYTFIIRLWTNNSNSVGLNKRTHDATISGWTLKR